MAESTMMSRAILSVRSFASTVKDGMYEVADLLTPSRKRRPPTSHTATPSPFPPSATPFPPVASPFPPQASPFPPPLSLSHFPAPDPSPKRRRIQTTPTSLPVTTPAGFRSAPDLISNPPTRSRYPFSLASPTQTQAPISFPATPLDLRSVFHYPATSRPARTSLSHLRPVHRPPLPPVASSITPRAPRSCLTRAARPVASPSVNVPHRASAGYAPAGNALRAVVASEQGVAGRKGEERRKVGDVFAKPHLGPAAVIRKRRREAEERRVKMGAAQEKQSKILDESSVMEKRADVLEGIAKRKEEEGGKGGEKEDDEGSYIDLAFMKVKKCDSLVWQKIFKLHGSAITRMAKTKSFSRHKQLEAWMVEQDMACLSRMREQAKKRPSLKPVVWDDDEARPEEPPKDGDFDVVYWSHADLTWDETRDEGAMMERRQQLTVRGKVEAFAPLTKCALKRLRFVLCDSGNLYKQLSKVDGCVISGEDIRRLKPSCWLNDEIVNAYMALLSARSEGAAKSNGGVIANGMSVKVPKTRIMNSFFFSRLVEYNKREGRTKYDYSRVKRWTRRFDVFSYDMMLIPINQQNLHWTLGLVNFKDKTVEHLDSMGTGGSESVREHLMQWVRDEAADKKKDIELSKWKGRAIDVPMQENSDDCGVFLCKYADFLCRGWNRFTFSQRHMNYFRSRIAHELLMGSA